MRWVWSPLWSLQVENFFCGSGREPSLAVIESRRKVADLMVAFGTTIGLRFVSADPEERHTSSVSEASSRKTAVSVACDVNAGRYGTGRIAGLPGVVACNRSSRTGAGFAVVMTPA